jgi:hypothetical protein
MLLLWWCPFKIHKEKLAGLQFTSTDYLRIVSIPLRIRWTIPLGYNWRRGKGIIYLYFGWGAVCHVVVPLDECHYARHVDLDRWHVRFSYTYYSRLVTYWFRSTFGKWGIRGIVRVSKGYGSTDLRLFISTKLKIVNCLLYSLMQKNQNLHLNNT